ncbi:MAG: hypothetical protein C4332_06685, partial [Meiothermus sp.]
GGLLCFAPLLRGPSDVAKGPMLHQHLAMDGGFLLYRYSGSRWHKSQLTFLLRMITISKT